MENRENLFFELFGVKPDNEYYAPSRVNIIGEHIDYNGGNVVLAPIGLYTKCYISKRNDKEIHLYSMTRKGNIIRNLDDLSYKNKSWENYPIGAISTLIKNGYKIENGFNILYDSNIPLSTGLASSTSLLDVTVYAISDLMGFDIDKKLISLIAWEAKIKFIQKRCGIMDFAIIALGEENKAMLLDCYKYKYEMHPFKLDGYKLLVLKTNKPKNNDDTLKERTREIDIALDILKQKYNKIENICDLNLKQLEESKELLEDNLYKRALHMVTENERVNEFVKALNNSDISLMAKIINDSHKSLKDNYEITGKHLDSIVNHANEQKGCIASRMMGAGFGGCAISIVKEENIIDFINNVKKLYYKDTNIECDIFECDISDGLKKKN